MNRTGIEYLDFTWSPIAMRCTKVSPGCDNCWHLKSAHRLSKNPKIPGILQDAYAGRTGPVLCPDRISDPVDRKKPAVIGTQLMGDLFHSRIPWNWQYKIFEMMLTACWHTFVVLTKRPDPGIMDDIYFHLKRNYGCHVFPLPNVWFGISAENQEQADKRIPLLLQIPAAVHFVSVEPMLSPVDLSQTVTYWDDPSAGISWVICGAESGQNARNCSQEWVINLKNQCVDAGIPFFLKQWHEYNLGCKPARMMVKMPELDGKIWDQVPGK